MSRHRADLRSGFTLVEVMLTTVLASVLLLALWSLLSMYSKTFEGGQARTEQSQLARALFEQISTDLESVLVPPPLPSGFVPPPPLSPGDAPPLASASSAPTIAPASATAPVAPSLPHYVSPTRPLSVAAPGLSSGSREATTPGEHVSASSSLRPAGVFGTSTSLQIDVLQPAMLLPAREPDELLVVDPESQPRADELKTVAYTFEEYRDPAHPTGDVQMRLVRREFDWARAHPAHGAEVVGSALGASADQWPETETDGSPLASESALDAFDTDEASSSLLETSVPEVLDFSLRYFDGTLWSEEWDSLSRQGLPVAIEVSLRLRSFEDPAAPMVEVAADKPGVDREKVEQWTHPTRRLLIPLTLARKAPSARGLPGAPLPGESSNPLGAPTNAGFDPR
jgi:prepilin-type N-terminal cleavage/methylation domain-containing protein